MGAILRSLNPEHRAELEARHVPQPTVTAFSGVGKRLDEENPNDNIYLSASAGPSRRLSRNASAASNTSTRASEKGEARLERKDKGESKGKGASKGKGERKGKTTSSVPRTPVSRPQ